MIDKIKNALKSRSVKLGTMLTFALCSVVMGAFATGETNATMDSIATATITNLTTVQQALLNLISQILPVALVVMGSILVVTLGIRLFRRFTNA